MGFFAHLSSLQSHLNEDFQQMYQKVVFKRVVFVKIAGYLLKGIDDGKWRMPVEVIFINLDCPNIVEWKVKFTKKQTNN